ncbi:unnamed protein product [Ixodes hexagonus]
MMVDGQTRRRSPSVEGTPQRQQPADAISTADGSDAPSARPGGSPDKADAPKQPTPVHVTPDSNAGTPAGEVRGRSAGRSRWLKLRTTVQLSGAISDIQKKRPLKREDSFLKRFSTRHIGETRTSGSDSATSPATEPRPKFFSKPNCVRLILGVLNPDENALFVWLWILTWCVLYNAWALILRQTFTELHTSSLHLWFVADGFSDLVYLLDIVVQFRTGYLEQGLMVCEARKLAGHYVRSRPFLMDLVALTPLDLLQFHFGVTPLLRFPRFIKVYRCYRFYYMVESRTIYPNLWRVVNLIHILLLLSHWFGCFYYMLSEFENYDGDWTYHKPDSPEWKALGRKYLASLYWSTLTLTTIGDLVTPSSNLQYIFTILCYLIGVFIFATIVGQVGNVITNRNASRLEFERLLDGAKLYMRHHKVPHNMQRRVQRWYDYSWSRGRMQGGGDINSALGCLPDKLKTELALHVNLKTLKKVTIFQECQPEFLHDLVLKMRAYIFTPGDLICRKGEVAREMFIIADGILEVISETGKVLTQMKAGDFFGEIGILNLDGFNRRTADVRSVGYSELFSLSREDVLSAMKDYPEAEDILQAMGRKRLMEARRAASTRKGDDIISRTSHGGPIEANAPSPQGSVHSRGPKSMDPMRRLRKDVKSLRQLLRNRSNTTAQKPPEIQLEMEPVMSSVDERHDDSDAGTPSTPVAKSLHKLFRKLHSRQESQGGQALKGIVTSISCIKGEEEMEDQSRRTGIRKLGTSFSMASSQETTPTQPLGAGLPLLTRIKMLRDAEKSSKQSAPDPSRAGGAQPRFTFSHDRGSRLEAPASGHSNLFERRRLSKLQAVSSDAKSTDKPRKSLAENLHRLMSGGDPSTKQGPVTFQVHTPAEPEADVTNQNIPLIKRVLLLKAMEEKLDRDKQAHPQLTTTTEQTSASSRVVHTKLSPPRPDTLSLSVQDKPQHPPDASSAIVAQPPQSRLLSPKFELEDEVFQSPSPKREARDIRSSFHEAGSVSGEHVVSKPLPKQAVGKPHEKLLHAAHTLATLEEQPSSLDSVTTDSQKQQSDSHAKSASKTAPQGAQVAVPMAPRHPPTSFRSRLWNRNSLEGHAARRSILRRMEAVEMESHEASQAVRGNVDDLRSPDNGPPRQRPRKIVIEGPSPDTDLEQCLVSGLLRQEDGIEQYVAAAMKHIKLAFKTYLHETHLQLNSKISQLEEDIKKKDALICDLRRKLLLQEQELSRRELSYLEEVSSLSDTSLSWSDEDELVLTTGSVDSARAEPLLEEEEDEAEDEDRVDVEAEACPAVPPEHVPARGRPFLYSWPRPNLPNSRSHRHRTFHSSSWHEPSLSALASDSALCGMAAGRLKPEDLWKLEFPASQEHSKAASMEHLGNLSSSSCATLPEFQTQFSPPIRASSVTSAMTYKRPPTSTNSDDWEVKMLVEEFEKKIQEDETSRRHSSYDSLSWNRVLSRNINHSDLPRRQMTTMSPYGSQDEGRRKHLRRKHSLRDDRMLRSLAAKQPAMDVRPKLTRFASLDMPRYHRYRHIHQNHHGDDLSGFDPFPESASSDQLRPASKAALKRRAFWQSRQRQNAFLSCQVPSGQDQQKLLAWRSLDEECETNVIDTAGHLSAQETSFSNECLWHPDQMPQHCRSSQLLPAHISRDGLPHLACPPLKRIRVCQVVIVKSRGSRRAGREVIAKIASQTPAPRRCPSYLSHVEARRARREHRPRRRRKRPSTRTTTGPRRM